MLNVFIKSCVNNDNSISLSCTVLKIVIYLQISMTILYLISSLKISHFNKSKIAI